MSVRRTCISERIVDASLGRRVLNSADVVVCVSRHVATYVHAIAPGAVTTVVHNGVDEARRGLKRNRPVLP